MTNEFWQFSLAVYAAPGVADECLDLQDHFGIDVNLLLFAAYVGSRRLVLSSDDVDQCFLAVREWREQVVHPLRSVRRATKTLLPQYSLALQRQIEDIRGKVKLAELESEKVQQDLLLQWLDGRHLAQAVGAESAVRNNVQMIFRCSRLAHQPADSLEKLVSASLSFPTKIAK
jgi:uncharacterized protein (TIGR02444 family)